MTTTTDVKNRLERLVRDGFGPRQVIDLDTALELVRNAYDLGKLDGSREVATTCGLLSVSEAQRSVLIAAVDAYRNDATISDRDLEVSRRIAENLDLLAMPRTTR